MHTYIQEIKTQLNKPFPLGETQKKSFRNICGVGAFVTVFIYYFFGDEFSTQGLNPLLWSLLFGGITIAIGGSYDFLVKRILQDRTQEGSWTFLKWILYMGGLLLLLAQVNYLSLVGLTRIEFAFASFFEITQHTLAVGILPVIFSGYLSQARNTRATLFESELIKQRESEPLVLSSKSNTQQLRLKYQDLLYLEARENYVYVYYVRGKEVKKELLRNTLKNMEAQLVDTPLIRCHRSFIVNPIAIMQIKGNAQGLKLRVNLIEKIEVPVSRTYIPLIRAHTKACH